MDALSILERIARRAHEVSVLAPRDAGAPHPFDVRNIHPALPEKVRDLFDDAHYAEATFEAFKFVDNEVARHSNLSKSGFPLMMDAFKDVSPPIALTPLVTTTDKDEQQGFKFLFAGSVLAIRNPRGHESGHVDDPDECLDHLALASLLLRRLEKAGFRTRTPTNRSTRRARKISA